MRLLSPRGAVAAVLSAALLVATPAVTATAAPAAPARVGHVTFVGASLTASGATLTIDWSDVKGAAAYEVFAAPSADGVFAQKTPRMTVTGSKAKIERLKTGADYFVQVRAVSSAGVAGLRSQRVGHGTMVAESAKTSALTTYRTVSWNVCSYACSGIAKRTPIINKRLATLKPDLVALQEASRYTKAPTGYRFVVNGQNDILVRSGQFSTIKEKGTSKDADTRGAVKFPRKYATPGQGAAWAALKHRSGSYVVVFDAHLLAGTGKSQVAQREYEAGRLKVFISSTLTKLQKRYGSLTNWKKVPVIIMGDLNSHKSRSNDDTIAVFEKSGWYDAFDQARSLTKQHFNTANPTMQAAPVRGGWWGDHVDKVLVRPSRSIVYTWANAGSFSKGRFVTPLGSDHHPLMVTLGIR